MWRGDPSTIAFTRFTFGFQVLFERLCEWETLIPKVTPFPQMSHLAMCLHLLCANRKSTFVSYQISLTKASLFRGKSGRFFKKS